MTREELAWRVGHTAKAVEAWERGTRHPRPAALEKLAEVLGHPVAWFFESPDPASDPSSRRAAA